MLNYYDAILYCFSLNIDGKTGWRLLTYDEHAKYYWVITNYSRLTDPCGWIESAEQWTTYLEGLLCTIPVRSLKDN